MRVVAEVWVWSGYQGVVAVIWRQCQKVMSWVGSGG